MGTPIKTLPQLQEAILSTYLFDAILAVAFIILLVIVANLIPWSGGKQDTSGVKRRLWFWILAAGTLFACLAFNFLAFFQNIAVATFKMDYVLHLALGSAAALACYIVVLIVVIKLQNKKTKIGSIDPITGRLFA